MYWLIKHVESFVIVRGVAWYDLEHRRTPEFVFMSTNMNFVHFLKENISSVVFSTEISLKKVFFQILRWDFFLHCGPKYAPYDQIIEMNIVPLDQGNRLVVIRASHDTTVRFYDRKLTFLSFVRKSSLEIDWNFAGFLCFSESQNTQNSAPATGGWYEKSYTLGGA